MSRAIQAHVPDVPEIPSGKRKGWWENTYSIKVITPMFGGVFPGEIDDITPVRVSSIRGQLRFWWRASRGSECTTTEELSAREGEIWGTTKQESKVLLSVKLTGRGKSEACASKGNGKFSKPNFGYPGYAIFPFQGTNQDSIKNAQKGVEFELVLESPEALRQDVEAALWAFCNFGGLGARTRRGCGALFCEDFAPADSTELLKIIDIYRKHNESPAHPWPELFTSLLLKGGDSSDASRAWNQAIKVLGDFRQGPGEGRNPPNDDPHRPGRSLWPEPETLRRITRSGDPKHKRMDTIPDDGFPRAEFGLPIIFHFQSKTDPQDPQLLPYFHEAKEGGTEGSRMGSPLILRPILFKNKKAASMILQLKTPPLETVALKFSSGRESVIKLFERKHIVHQRFAAYSKSPLGTPKKGGAVRSPKGSAIEGFLAFARENGFQEVKK